MKKHKPFNLAGAPKAVVEAAGSSFRFAINKHGDDGPAELFVMDVIGDNFWSDEPITGEAITKFLTENRSRDITVRINSPGGSVYDGFVIFNALANHAGHVTSIIEGMAFSSASTIALAADEVKMYKSSDFGIHRASVVAFGNQKEMRSTAEFLGKIDDHILDIYENKTGLDRKQLENWMDGESDGTIFSATECLQHGFCDEVIDPKSVAKDSKKEIVTNCCTRIAARNRLQMQRVCK